MSKLNELLEELCPNGVEYVELGTFATVFRGGNFQKKHFVEKGKPCIHYGQIYTRYNLFAKQTISSISEATFEKQKKAVTNDIIMAVTSENLQDVCKCMAWLGKDDAAVSGHTAIIHHNQNPKYLVYYFSSSIFFEHKVKLAHGTKVIEVSPDSLKNIKIPLPPLSVQNEIVRILDNFTELTAALTAELTARKKQYEYYREKLLTPRKTEHKWYKLGEIAEIGTGSSNANEHLTAGVYPFYVRSQEIKRKNSYEFDETAIITAGDGDVGKVFHYVEGKYALHQRAYRIHITAVNVYPRYLYHYMKDTFYDYIRNTAVNSSVMSLRRKMLDDYPVPVPSIEVQHKIINVLDNFESICSDLNIGLPAEVEARKKQYEFYRDALLTFAETGNLTNNEQRTTNNEQRTTNNEQRTTNNEQRTTIVR